MVADESEDALHVLVALYLDDRKFLGLLEVFEVLVYLGSVLISLLLQLVLSFFDHCLQVRSFRVLLYWGIFFILVFW